jgi:hypothetical protein
MADHSNNNREGRTLEDSDIMDPSSRPLLSSDQHSRDDTSPTRGQSNVPSYAPSFLDQVAEGIHEQDLVDLKRQMVRYVSFAVAVISW